MLHFALSSNCRRCTGQKLHRSTRLEPLDKLLRCLGCAPCRCYKCLRRYYTPWFLAHRLEAPRPSIHRD